MCADGVGWGSGSRWLRWWGWGDDIIERIKTAFDLKTSWMWWILMNIDESLYIYDYRWYMIMHWPRGVGCVGLDMGLSENCNLINGFRGNHMFRQSHMVVPAVQGKLWFHEDRSCPLKWLMANKCQIYIYIYIYVSSNNKVVRCFRTIDLCQRTGLDVWLHGSYLDGPIFGGWSPRTQQYSYDFWVSDGCNYIISYNII